MNTTINKIINKNLIRDLDDIVISTEFNRNCFYLDNVPKLNTLISTNLQSDRIKEIFNSMKNSFTKSKLEINNNRLLFNI